MEKIINNLCLLLQPVILPGKINYVPHFPFSVVVTSRKQKQNSKPTGTAKMLESTKKCRKATEGSLLSNCGLYLLLFMHDCITEEHLPWRSTRWSRCSTVLGKGRGTTRYLPAMGVCIIVLAHQALQSDLALLDRCYFWFTSVNYTTGMLSSSRLSSSFALH